MHFNVFADVLIHPDTRSSADTTLQTLFVPVYYYGWEVSPTSQHINTLRPRQNGRHFADMFKCIFLNENVWIPIEISLKFVPKGSFKNNPALFQIMAWRRPGDKPLSEPMLVSSLTHICVTRPQWVKAEKWPPLTFWNENLWISIKISLSLFLNVQLTIFQHWFR